MGRVLGSLGAACVRFRWTVVVLWLVLAVGMTMVTTSLGPTTNDSVSLPGTDSQAATDLLAAEFPPQQNGTNPAIYHATSGTVDDKGANQQAIKAAVKALKVDPAVYSVTNPFQNPQAGLVSKDHKYAFIPVLLRISGDQLTEHKAQHLYALATEPAVQVGMKAAVGGSIGSTLSQPDTAASERLGMMVAAVILALTFGSLIAMGMPLVSAVLGLMLGIVGIWLLGTVADIPSVGVTIARMIGLGVGIDYALFLVSRHRRYVVRDGLDPHTAAGRAVATSGGAIVFAATTVVIALLSLQVAGIPFIAGLGWACAVAVATAALAALTLLPALLAIVGGGINRLRLPLIGRRTDHPIAARWVALITRWPLVSVLVAVGLMVPLILPVRTLVLGQEDLAVAPPGTTEREAFDLMSRGFGPGYNGPLLVAVSIDPPAKPSNKYEKQYNEATALQKNLEYLQTYLPEQQQELEEQQAVLEEEGAQLQDQAAQLQAEGDQLKAEQAALESEATDLKNQETELRDQGARLRSQAEELADHARTALDREKTLARELARNRAEQRVLERRLEKARDPAVIAALEQELAAAQAEEERLLRKLAKNTQRLRDLRSRGEALRSEAKGLEDQAAVLAQEGAQLVTEGLALHVQADELTAEGAALEAEQASLEAQAASLQEWGDELQAQSDEAKQEQKQAEQLQDQLTKELTQAGGDPRGTDPRIVKLQKALADPADVDLVTPPQINKAGTALTMSVIADSRPADPKTADLVVAERTEAIPPALSPGMAAYVGGSTASNVDLATLISEKLLLVILTVVALSSLLLLVAFRSLLVPVQAALANLLAAGAAFGLVTVIFQWGWGLEAIGLPSPYGTVPVASYVPLMMFAALFGLSMDYQVFVMSTIQGEFAAGHSAREAVRIGLTESARIIVTAALIMMSVFGSFVLNPDPIVKQFGVGLTVAVGLAAFLVLLFAPAMLMLFGKWTWKLPRWLDRILPDLDLEGRALERSLADTAEAVDTAGVGSAQT